MKLRFFSTTAPLLVFSFLLTAASAPRATAQIGPGDLLVPVVTLTAPDPTASESGDAGRFRLFRAGPTNLTLNVFWMLGGTAVNGEDYGELPYWISIPAGQREVVVPVYPKDDDVAEGPETVVARLVYAPTLGPLTYQIGSPSNAVVTIADNDREGNRPPEVKLTRPLDGQIFVAPTKIPLRALTVDPDGYVDYLAFFADEQKIGEQARNYLVPPPPGELAVFEMVWTNAAPGRHTLFARAKDDQGAWGNSQLVTIWVVETNRPPMTNLPIVSIVARDCVASEGTNCLRWLGWTNTDPLIVCRTNTATFVVRRQGPTNDALRVQYRISGTASNGVDYVALPGVVEIPAGRRAAEIQVIPLDDDLCEGIETVVLGLRVPAETLDAVPPYLVGFPERAAAVIVDADGPRPDSCVLRDRCFHFMKPGANGTWWRIECSSDLIHWRTLCTTQVTDGAIHFVDPDSDETPLGYYRAVPEAEPALE